ncbi:MAG: hypothetical protein HYX53_02920 [Chloroflexi bacterium]|nr:hypothetical protein [Chloroflexota bacterium]
MKRLRRLFLPVAAHRSNAVELAGLVLIAIGVGDIYLPAGLVFVGAALVFVAQGME